MKQYRFKRWLRNWINNVEVEPKPQLVSVTDDNPDMEKSLNLRVWFANGGKVVQTHRYDRVKDRNNTSMYVITDDQNLGRELEKIITMDSLRG